jgi:hypothetical protein
MAKDTSQTGSWAFILGVVIAIVAGIVAGTVGLNSPVAGWVTLLLVVLGLIVGFLNIGDKDINSFLVAAIALAAVGSANLQSINVVIPILGTVLQSIVLNIAVFVFPAALIIALKAIHGLAKTSS